MINKVIRKREQEIRKMEEYFLKIFKKSIGKMDKNLKNIVLTLFYKLIAITFDNDITLLRKIIKSE